MVFENCECEIKKYSVSLIWLNLWMSTWCQNVVIYNYTCTYLLISSGSVSSTCEDVTNGIQCVYFAK